jgi:hypothetical protein
MSSVLSYKPLTNALYVNIADTRSSILTPALTNVEWGTLQNFPGLSTAGQILLRDMGKTMYLPASGGASQSTILRKVQLVTGYYGTGAAASGAGAPGGASEYYTGYIRLGGQTYGGGTGVPSGFARAN